LEDLSDRDFFTLALIAEMDTGMTEEEARATLDFWLQAVENREISEGNAMTIRYLLIHGGRGSSTLLAGYKSEEDIVKIKGYMDAMKLYNDKADVEINKGFIKTIESAHAAYKTYTETGDFGSGIDFNLDKYVTGAGGWFTNVTVEGAPMLLPNTAGDPYMAEYVITVERFSYFRPKPLTA